MELSLNISELWSHLHDNKLVKSDERNKKVFKCFLFISYCNHGLKNTKVLFYS